MRTFLLFSTLCLTCTASLAFAQGSGSLEQAVAAVRETAGCRISSQSRQRVYGTCRTREQATALRDRFRQIASGGQTVFGPLCSYDRAEEPRTLRGCEAQIEGRN